MPWVLLALIPIPFIISSFTNQQAYHDCGFENSLSNSLELEFGFAMWTVRSKERWRVYISAQPSYPSASARNLIPVNPPYPSKSWRGRISSRLPCIKLRGLTKLPITTTSPTPSQPSIPPNSKWRPNAPTPANQRPPQHPQPKSPRPAPAQFPYPQKRVLEVIRVHRKSRWGYGKGIWRRRRRGRS